MAINLNSLIYNVRSTLSDVPEEFLTDSQIYVEIDKANAYCNAIVMDDTTETYLTKCIEVVAAFYSYINYTTLSERQLGTLPPTSKIRLDALRNVAVSFLQLVSKFPINENLTIDIDSLKESTCGQISLTNTVLNDD
ncbi:MAG: hypothetical protein M0R51_17840 [Clostridia bacterium]|jgi:hypothetical protein|nr:hypothetical protein [Clostridia bacterium]